MGSRRYELLTARADSKRRRAPRLPASAFVPAPDLERFVGEHSGRFKWDSHCRVVLDAEASRQHWTVLHPIVRDQEFGL